MKDYGKVYETADKALADIPDGVTIAAHTWAFCGTPHHLFAAVTRTKIKDIILTTPSFIRNGQLEPMLPGPTSLLPQLKKIISPGIGGARAIGSDDEGFLDAYIAEGRLEIEVIPHGIWIERMHAAAMGLGGFYNPVGIGTSVEVGKEKRIIDGKEYFLEKPLRPDIGLIKAHKADRFGNLTYYKASRGANPIIAMASKLTIVEVDELVDEGEIDPELVVTPGIYVDRIVRIEPGDIGSAKQKIDVMNFILNDVLLKKVLLGVTDKGGKK